MKRDHYTHINSTRKRSLCFVYFVEAPDVGLIKIGITERPESRFSALRGSSPVAINVIGMVRGNARDEHAIHARFIANHHHCEWFHATDELRAFINGLLSITPTSVRRKLLAMPCPIIKGFRAGRPKGSKNAPGTGLRVDSKFWNRRLQKGRARRLFEGLVAIMQERAA